MKAPFFVLTGYDSYSRLSFVESEDYKRWSGPWSDRAGVEDAIKSAQAIYPSKKFFVCGAEPQQFREPSPDYNAIPAEEFNRPATSP